MKSIYFLLLLLALSNKMNAQQDNMPGGLDGGKYKPKNDTDNENMQHDSDLSLGVSNLISFSINHLYRGMAVLSYERHMGKRFGVKGSIGYCYSKDWISTILSGDFSYNYKDPKELNQIVEDNPYNALGPNYYVDVTGKIYTNVNDFYYHLQLRSFAGLSFRNYHQSYGISPDYIVPSNVKSLPVQNSALSFVIGQMLYRESGLFVEYYLGLGRISSIYNRFIYNQAVGDFEYESTKSSHNRLLLTLGIAVGFGF